jgi:hypothetical protein
MKSSKAGIKFSLDNAMITNGLYWPIHGLLSENMQLRQTMNATNFSPFRCMPLVYLDRKCFMRSQSGLGWDHGRVLVMLCGILI